MDIKESRNKNQLICKFDQFTNYLQIHLKSSLETIITHMSSFDHKLIQNKLKF